MQHVDVVIIGGGPAGLSTAIWCKRLGINHLLLEQKGELGGQLKNIHNKIIDYPGVTADNGQEMKRMLVEHFHRLECSCRLNTKILSIDHLAKTIKMQRESQIEELKFQYLIIATGAGQRRLGVSGEREMIARGEKYSATADSHLFKNKVVAVVGGGDRAFEGAVLLAEAGATVYLIHRSEHFKARLQYVKAAEENANINRITNAEVTAIHGEERVTSIDLIDKKGERFSLSVDAVFVRIGIKPNSELVKEIVEVTETGLIVTDQIGRTSKSFIYAVGDICTNPLFSSISASMGQGAIVAKHLSALITNGCGESSFENDLAASQHK